jgi:hypothetical protein
MGLIALSNRLLVLQLSFKSSNDPIPASYPFDTAEYGLLTSKSVL